MICWHLAVVSKLRAFCRTMPETGNPLRPWLQFSMFRLMVVVTLAAILLGLAVTFGGFMEVMFVSLVWCVLPTPLIIGSIYAQRDIKTFSIGALVPWFTLILTRFPITSFLGATIWLLAMSGVC